MLAVFGKQKLTESLLHLNQKHGYLFQRMILSIKMIIFFSIQLDSVPQKYIDPGDQYNIEHYFEQCHYYSCPKLRIQTVGYKMQMDWIDGNLNI